jgi:hypothetical protein
VIKAKCGHVVEKKCIDIHDGLCRKCHSNFSFIQDLESKGGEDALIQYWYAMILTKLSGVNEQESACHRTLDRILSRTTSYSSVKGEVCKENVVHAKFLADTI